MHPQNYTMDRGAQQRTWKKRRPAAPFDRETGLFNAAQKILFDQGCPFYITSVSFIVPCINAGNGRNRRNDAHKNCQQCHDTECCKTNNRSKFHICPPRPYRLMKSSTTHCPSIFPYNFSKGNPFFGEVSGVMGTVPLTTGVVKGTVPMSFR